MMSPIAAPAPKPVWESPAAAQKPGTPGTGPSSGRLSGVMPSGPFVRWAISARPRMGTRRIAPSMISPKSSQSDGRSFWVKSHGTPSTDQATGSRSKPPIRNPPTSSRR